MGINAVIILAIIQALTEFIPVSSTGHLIIADRFGGLNSSLALDVMLHIGTLIALVVYYRHKIVGIIRSLLYKRSSRLLIMIIISSIPAVVAGVAFEDLIVDELRAVWVVALMLALLGVVMVFEKKVFSRQPKRTLETLRWPDALIIGFGQALSLVPGTSRSGSSILAGRLVGLNNPEATDYAFLIGIPVIFGAGLQTLLKNETQVMIADQPWQAVIGVVVTALVGWLAIDFVVRIVKSSGLRWFGLYRVGLASLLLTLMIIN